MKAIIIKYLDTRMEIEEIAKEMSLLGFTTKQLLSPGPEIRQNT